MLRSLLPGALSALTLWGGCAAALALSPSTTPAERDIAPRLVVRDARLPVRLESVDLQAEVVGRAVQTRIELTFRNPNEQALEGELQFPLREDQIVTGFALDIQGELRPAVPVDKAKGQQVFEEVIRARVDPALLEVTQGRNYKLRVYPLPPGGTRRVVLHLAQTLGPAVGGSSPLVLPLDFAGPLPRLNVELRVADTAASSIVASAPGIPPQAFVRSQQGRFGRLSLRQSGLAGLPGLTIGLPPRHEALAATQTVAGRTYFYAEAPVRAPAAPRAAPRRLALLWDASGSGAQRDHGREFALLDTYFAALGEVEVSLRVGRDVAEPPQRFQVRDGRWDELRRVLEGLAYDGATNLPALLSTEGCDLALLFSDGLSNWGPAQSTPGTVPVYALGSGSGADTVRLRALAEQSGGEWLDLSSLSARRAVDALQTRKPRLVGLSSTAANQLVSASPYASDGRLALAGILSEPEASIELSFELPDGRIERQRLRVSAPAEAQAASSQVAQRWASLRLAALQAELEDRRGEIRRIGKAFGLATPETSLIVLDAVADYVRHEIEPPASLRAEYELQLARRTRQAGLAQARHLDQVAARFAAQVAWWEKPFPKDSPPRKTNQARPAATESLAGGDRARVAGLSRAEAAAAPRLMAPAPSPAALAPPGVPDAELSAKRAGASERAASPQASIRLTPWAPDSAYARRLRESTPESVYRRYLDERPDFVGSTAFFLDAADVLFAKDQPELALRVLSNLAEMNLENRHILRVLGYRLLQARQARLAIPVFENVLRLSPDEPQSHRDLGQALAEAEQWQPAAEHLWQVVSRPWNARFPDIDMTALAELNALIDRASRAGRPVRTDAFDPRLLRHLPLDLRIILAWDADNTDIDLWVTDPDGEKTYYGHRLSRQGGRVSQDVTGGYGPEEFALRQAKPGRYTVQAQFYGHRQQVVAPATTLMMRLSTGFGRPGQKDELVTLRLKGASDLVTVGSFEVGP